MPTKSQVLKQYQQDLQEMNATAEADLAKIEKARLKKFASIRLRVQQQTRRIDAAQEASQI